MALMMAEQLAVLDTLSGELSDDVVEVVGVGVAVPSVVADTRLVVDLVPDNRVRLTSRHRRTDSERQSTSPSLGQELQHLTALKDWSQLRQDTVTPRPGAPTPGSVKRLVTTTTRHRHASARSSNS